MSYYWKCFQVIIRLRWHLPSLSIWKSTIFPCVITKYIIGKYFETMYRSGFSLYVLPLFLTSTYDSFHNYQCDVGLNGDLLFPSLLLHLLIEILLYKRYVLSLLFIYSIIYINTTHGFFIFWVNIHCFICLLSLLKPT